MEIRSLTLFTTPDQNLSAASSLFEAAASQFDVPLQSHRVAFAPFPDWWNEREVAPGQATRLVARWQDVGADYLCLGPVQLRHDARWLEMLPEILGAGGALFASAEVADTQGRIDTARCAAVSRLIREASQITADGFGNLYFTALANCPPGSPFFPVAYQQPGGKPSFALALEAADLALAAFHAANSLQEARQNLVSAIESQAHRLQEATEDLARNEGIAFAGIDFSLAPFPHQARSLAGALEALGPAHVGAPGSFFAAAFITEALDRARFQRCGFSGLMLPVLEDAVLARRAAERRVTVNDLLGLAALCGVGLDTIPLPGDIPEDVLAGILLDVAALATRLDKPLTARLMPMPGLAAGDAVRFDFPYFANSGVMNVASTGILGPMGHGESIDLLSLRERNERHGR